MDRLGPSSNHIKLLADIVLNLRAGLHTHSSNPTHSVSNVITQANQYRFTHVRLRRTSFAMLLLHMLLLFALGTSVAAIPVSQQTPREPWNPFRKIFKKPVKPVDSPSADSEPTGSVAMSMKRRINGVWKLVNTTTLIISSRVILTYFNRKM